jgi:uncharacterized protein YabE (DUF348 family)
MSAVKKVFTRRDPIVIFIMAVALLLVGVVPLTQTAFAGNTYRVMDGDRVLVHTSYATDPETVLQELGLTLGEADLYEVEQTSGIREIRVRRLQTIHVDICGVVKTVQTYGETVGDLLRRLNVVLSGDMSLSHSLFTKTFDGMNLTVARVVQTTQHYMETIPFETTYCIDPELASGERKVLIPGQEGIMRCTVIVTYINGLEAERVVISQQVTQQPVDQVVAVGAAG